MKLQLDLSTYDPIPKLIHITWKDNSIWESSSPLIEHGLIALKNLNPDFRIELSTDEEVELYLKMHLSRWDYFKIKNKKIVEKTDLWRLLKIYNEGGIYVDIDRYCNISFDEIIQDTTRCILPTTNNVDFSQDLMISCKGNPIFEKAIEYNLKKRQLLNPRGVFHLGPPIYMKAVSTIVFGEEKKRNPGQGVMENYRAALERSTEFETYHEQPPYDTILFDRSKSTAELNYEDDKKQFYASQNVIPWNMGLDKNTIIFVVLLVLIVIVLIII